jgi:hypothetical protein
MVADRRVSPWEGGETATAAVRNVMRTTTARSPAWTRGEKGGERVTLTRPWAEESEGRGREESTVRRLTPFEVAAGEAGEGWGSGVRRRVEEKMGQREGAGFSDL